MEWRAPRAPSLTWNFLTRLEVTNSDIQLWMCEWTDWLYFNIEYESFEIESMLFSVFRTFSTFERGKYISSHFRVNTRHFCWVTRTVRKFETENSFKNCDWKKIVSVLFAAHNVWKSPLPNSFVTKSYIIQQTLKPLCAFAYSSHFFCKFLYTCKCIVGVI
jgi:hypothetical protein